MPPFAEFRQEYQKFKRNSALLDFDDLLVQARDLLRNSPEVRQALSQRYAHILVDEFQDTDPVQCEILFFLCGEDGGGEWFQRKLRPGQLFLVADPKQSIYRFRRADIEMYCRVRDIVGEQFPGNVLPITANFRSVEPVLQHVNAGFCWSTERNRIRRTGVHGERTRFHPAPLSPALTWANRK